MYWRGYELSDLFGNPRTVCNAYKGISHSPVMVQFMTFRVSESCWIRQNSQQKLIKINFMCQIMSMILPQQGTFVLLLKHLLYTVFKVNDYINIFSLRLLITLNSNYFEDLLDNKYQEIIHISQNLKPSRLKLQLIITYLIAVCPWFY